MDFTGYANEFYSGLANFFEIAGFFVSIVGFAVSVFFAWRSKRASELARDAAQSAQMRLLDMANFGDLETATAVLEETMRLLRRGGFEIALDRLTIVKRDLVKIKSNSNSFSENDLTVLQGAVTQVSLIMTSVETCLSKQRSIDVPRLNGLLSDEIARLSELKSNVKNDLVR